MTDRNEKAAGRGAHVGRRRGLRLAIVLLVGIVGGVPVFSSTRPPSPTTARPPAKAEAATS
jgi:hypothetical protein